MDEPNPAPHLCECGCGTPTKVATETDTRYGTICGMPRRYVLGHGYNRKGRFVTPGERFGRGVVLEPEIRVSQPNGTTRRGARLICDCGRRYVTLIDRLVSGDSRSCGCLQGRQSWPGCHGHALYKTWEGVLARCENPDFPGYRYWGGRGITVCERWHDPRLFIADIEREIGPRPPGRSPGGKPLWSLDRRDNDGHYEPGNVRWATAKMQGANRRPCSGNVGDRNQARWRAREWRTETCAHCTTEFRTRSIKDVLFCSKYCGARFRTARGDYDVERACHMCGGTFTISRHKKTKHCSRSCAATCRHAGACPSH